MIKHLSTLKLVTLFAVFVTLTSSMPAQAAEKLIGVSLVKRASGIQLDAYAVQEMIIEHIKDGRNVTQTNLMTLVGTVIPDNDTDDWKVSQLIDDVLRIHGVPASRTFISSGSALEAIVRQNIDQNLPVILIGLGHQVIVDGYRDSPFKIHVLNPDPTDTSDPWRTLSGTVLQNPNMTIREAITIPVSVTINTEAYGTITYSSVTNGLSGGNPPSEARLREALKSAAPYVLSSDRVYVIDYGSGSDKIGLYLAILNSSHTGGIAFVKDVLGEWGRDSLDDNAGFPLLPVDNSGYLDVTNIERDIELLSLAYRVQPQLSSMNSRAQITVDQRTGVQAEFNHFFIWHDKVQSRKEWFKMVLREMVALRGQVPLDLAEEWIAYGALETSVREYLEELGEDVIEDTIELTVDNMAKVDVHAVWGKTWSTLYHMGFTRSKAVSWANIMRARLKGAKRFFAWIDETGLSAYDGIVIDVASDAGKKFIHALQPVAFVEEMRDDLIAVRDRLGFSGDDLLLRQAITEIVAEIDGERDTRWAQMAEYWKSGEFLSDVFNVGTLTQVLKVAGRKLIQKGVPIVGQILLAWEIGYTIGMILTNNDDVAEKLQYAVYAGDIEAIFHRVAYQQIRPIIISQYSSSQINQGDLLAWDSAVQLTYVAEGFFWKSVADAFNATGFLTNLLTALNGYGTARQAAENHFMPDARRAAGFARQWDHTPSVELVINTTSELLWDRKVGVIIAAIVTPDDGASASGIVDIGYIGEATYLPMDITLKVDGNVLTQQNDVYPSSWVYSWNTTPHHDNQVHTIELSAVDNAGNTATDSVPVLVGSPSTSNATPTIQLLTPNNQAAFRYFRIDWTDDDSDDDAIITLGYDTDGSGCDGTVIQDWISEDWITDYWYWRNLPSTGGTNYRVYAMIRDDLHDPVCVYSPGALTIETPTSGNGFLFDHVEIDDEAEGDGDGIWEAGERVRLKMFITNSTGGLLNDVYAVIKTSETLVAINDDDATYNNVFAGQTNSNSDFEVTIDSGWEGGIAFQLEIYYRENGGILRKDVETFNLEVSSAGSQPQFQVGSITYLDNDPDDADNDGAPESGEEHILVNIQLINNGNAPATGVYAVIDPATAPSGFWQNNDAEYLDIPAGGSQPPQAPFEIGQIPLMTTGNIPVTMTVYYGANQQYSQQLSFNMPVQAAAWLKVQPVNYDFGVAAPGALVSTTFNIQNIGSAAANITSISPSGTGLTFTNVPSSIAAGQSASFTANLNTTGLSGSLVRGFTVNSNAHMLSKNTGQLSGTVYLIVPSTYQVIRQEQLTNGPLNIGGGDTDGDGLREIIVSAEFPDVVGNNDFTTIYVLEQTTVGADTFVEVWNSGNAIPQLVNEPGTMAVSDINGDGKDDVAVVTSGPIDVTHRLFYITSTGNNSLSLTEVYSTTTMNRGFSAVAIGDSDNDGTKEIIAGASSNTEARFYVFEHTGGTSFANRWTSPLITQPSSSDESPICEFGVGDTDLDGSREIVVGTRFGQVQVYENTGNDSYNASPVYNARVESGVGGSSDTCGLAVRDLDNDTRPDISYGNSDSNEVWVLESSSNNSWSIAWNQAIAPETGVDVLRLYAGDTDGDGQPDLSITYNGPDGFVVYETVGNNSYAPIFRTTDPALLPDDADGLAIVNIDSTPLPEILLAHPGGFDGYSVLGLAKDLILNNWDIVFDPATALEGDNINLSASVTNVSGQPLSNILVKFYDGDPVSGGTLLGSVTLPSISNGGAGVAQLTHAFGIAGVHSIYAVADADNHLVELNETNNQGIAAITIGDNDVTPPEITNVTVAEYNGDGDDRLEDNEQIIVSWTVTDSSGIQSTNLISDCSFSSPTNSVSTYQAVAGPCILGVYSFSITATDADNLPSSSDFTDEFTIIAHQPVIVSHMPLSGATNVSRFASVQVLFGTDMEGSSLTSQSFVLETLTGTPIIGTIIYDGSARLASLIPSSPLASNTTYRVKLLSGMAGIRDTNSNTLDADYLWQFTIQPNQPPLAPFMPNPSNGLSDLPNLLTLSWNSSDPENDLLSFDVFLGTSNPPTTLICSNIGTLACDPGPLNKGVIYYWRVNVSDGTNTVQSAIWSFTTRPPDLMPPTVSKIDTVNSTADGTLTEGEAVASSSVPITQIIVVYSEPVANPPDNTQAHDVTNPANYRLILDGNGDLETVSCTGEIIGDDEGITLNYITYSSTTRTATLGINNGRLLVPGGYRFFVCGSQSIQDLEGNTLDGNNDGAGGDDFVRTFTVLDDQPPTSAPQLLNPPNHALTNNSMPTLEWGAVNHGYAFDLQLDDNTAFASPQTIRWNSLMYIPSGAFADGTIYWRVRAVNDAINATGPWSSYYSFTVDTLPPTLPALLSPINVSATMSPQPTFIWSAVSGAVRYEMQLDTASSPTITVVNGNVTSYKPPGPLLHGTYYWRVRAFDAAGNPSDWSDPAWRVTIVSPPNAAPARNSYTTATPTLTWGRVSWATGYEVQVDSSSSFTVPLDFTATLGADMLRVSASALGEGTYYWRVRAKKPDGTWGGWSAVDTFVVDLP